MTKDFSPTKQSMYITILNFLLYNLPFLKHFDESNEKNSHPINFFVTKRNYVRSFLFYSLLSYLVYCRKGFMYFLYNHIFP